MERDEVRGGVLNEADISVRLRRAYDRDSERACEPEQRYRACERACEVWSVSVRCGGVRGEV